MRNMASSGNKQASAQTILDRLAKRPILLIILTASISFGVQQIPLSTITSTLKTLHSASNYQFRLSDFKESLQQLLKPPLLLAFVCIGILFIVYTSNQDGGENRAEDQHQNVSEPRRGLLTRTATLGQSIFSQFITHANASNSRLDQQIHGSVVHDTAEDACPFASSIHEDGEKASLSHARASILSNSAETRTAKSMAQENLKTGIAGSKTKLSRPKTSTDFSSRNPPIVDPKFSYSPRSFRDDPEKLDKEELKGRFEDYLGNFRRQLRLQKQESLLAKQLDLELKEVKHDTKRTLEASSIVTSDLLNGRETGPELKASAAPKTKNDLSEDQVRERTDAFLASLEGGSKSRREETKFALQHKHHSKSYSLGSSSEKLATSNTKDAYAPELLHSNSHQLVRGDSLAVDNQKFESFLQKFRNDLKLQKQESNLRKQLIENEF